ncbi:MULTISPECIES: Lrp/AsnC family transcriptional regulator [Actinomadura]|uniref:Lrp/AsnC family transcriptional regulator n=1 Tax=Actinomadura yumaensis TaxID=111807 RepID=A0ABW2CHG2_9ACTN|nr:AsnC family transcriptional regulator [Actinomadura sp. J1-007]MWK39823.1 AsnC family transcriptional regulator [Actinomadura sp. J1-007]
MKPVNFDDLDRKLVHALELDSRASFSRIGGVLGVSDRTVARRFNRLRAEAGLRVVGMRDGMRLGEDQWILRLRCAPAAAEPIADALAQRPDTAYIGLGSGGTEIICLTRPRTPADQDDLLLGRLPRTPSIVQIHAQQLLHRFYGGPAGWFNKRGALAPAEAAALRGPSAPNGPARIAPDDEALVAALEHDGRATYPELRKATGFSEFTVKRRLRELLGSGALYIDVDYDPGRFGYGVTALLWITAAPGELDRLGRTLATHREICFACATGGPSNLVAAATTPDIPSLYAYLSGRLGRLSGMERMETTTMLRMVKQLTHRGGPREAAGPVRIREAARTGPR